MNSKKKNYQEIFKKISKKENELNTKMNGSIIEVSYQMIPFLKEILSSLKDEVLCNDFRDVEEEIAFFKETKPKIQGLLIYYNYVYEVEVSCPIGDDKCLIAHYKRSLKKISKHNLRCNRTRCFYEYIKAKRTDKDGAYFTRSKNKDFVCNEGNSFVFADLKFTTCYDCIFSLLLGEEKFCNYITSKIAFIKINKDYDPLKLNWTGSKNSMIELIYALSVSNIVPQTNIRTIANVFEKIFNMNLGDIHHAYHKMKYRSQSRTIFLDRLKEALTKHLDKGDI